MFKSTDEGERERERKKEREERETKSRILSLVEMGGCSSLQTVRMGFTVNTRGHLSVEFIRRRVHIGRSGACVCIFRESGGALLMERIVLLCTGDERITVPCPPFRATPGQYRAVVNQASFLDEPHSNSRRFMLAEHAFRFRAPL